MTEPTEEEYIKVQFGTLIINPLTGETERYDYPDNATTEQVNMINRMAQLRSDTLWAKYQYFNHLQFIEMNNEPVKTLPEKENLTLIKRIFKWLM